MSVLAWCKARVWTRSHCHAKQFWKLNLQFSVEWYPASSQWWIWLFIQRVISEGCVQLAGLSSHCSCSSALAPNPHVLTHIRDAKGMSFAAMLLNDIHLLSSTKPTMICVTIWTNIMLFDKISPAFSLVFFRPPQLPTAFSKYKPNSFKDSTSPLPGPLFSQS